MKNISFFLCLLRTSIKASISNRTAFLFESSLLIVNNLIFFSMWWIFFRQFNNIGGWNINDMAASISIISGAYGIAHICFGGIKNLGMIILNGDLDSFMTQPKSLLIHLIGSKSNSKGWGYLMTMGILTILGGFAKAHTFPLILLMMFSSCLILVSISIIVHSLSFWLGSIESVSQKYLNSLFVFAIYPTNIYSGILQLVLFTLIPAGLISYIPVELLRSFSWFKMFVLIGSSFVFFALALYVFHLGLKRYESGNKFGMKL